MKSLNKYVSALVVLLLLFIQEKTYSQQVEPLISKKQQKSYDLDTLKKHPISLQLHGGTQGVGLDARYGVMPQLSLRLGGSAVLPVKINNAFEFADFTSNNSLSGDFVNFHLYADYSPFKKSSFRLVGGLAYLFKGNGKLNVVPKGDNKFGNIALAPEDVGDLNFDISWKGIAPYFGIGLFKSFPKRTFNINFDLGTYYLTAPKATVVGTKMLSANDSQSELITNNMSDYRWLPVIQLNFNFRIK